MVITAPPLSAPRVLFDRLVLRMSPDAVSAYWIDMRIRGRANPPRSVSSAVLIQRIVARNKEALSYLPFPLPMSTTGKGSPVKVLRIDGYLPDNPKYPLQER